MLLRFKRAWRNYEVGSLIDADGGFAQLMTQKGYVEPVDDNDKRAFGIFEKMYGFKASNQPQEEPAPDPEDELAVVEKVETAIKAEQPITRIKRGRPPKKDTIDAADSED